MKNSKTKGECVPENGDKVLNIVRLFTKQRISNEEELINKFSGFT